MKFADLWCVVAVEVMILMTFNGARCWPSRALHWLGFIRTGLVSHTILARLHRGLLFLFCYRLET